MVMTGRGNNGRFFLSVKKSSMFGAWFSFWEKADSIREELRDTNIHKPRTYTARAQTLTGPMPLHPETVIMARSSVICSHSILFSPRLVPELGKVNGQQNLAVYPIVFRFGKVYDFSAISLEKKN